MEALIIVLGFIIGFVVYFFTSSPGHLKNKFFKIDLGRVSLIPEVKVTIHGKIYHLHHWLYLSLILGIVVVISGNFFATFLFWKGILLGGISQGLTYKDRFKIRQ